MLTHFGDLQDFLSIGSILTGRYQCFQNVGVRVVVRCSSAVGVTLLRVSVETDVPCNLTGFGKSPTSPSFRKILTFLTLENAFSNLLR